MSIWLKDFKVEIDKLVSGDLTEIHIEPTDFLAFRDAWLDHPEKKRIIGEAQHKGHVVYRLDKDS